MNKNNIIVELKHVSKHYGFSPRSLFVGKKNTGSHSSGIWALKDINLVIREQDRVGIVGSNGAGKSTLLKVVAGIAQATSGQVNLRGRVVSLMKLEAGFSPELTGRDNIVLNAMLAGMSRKEAINKTPEIIRYADIGKFIDAPFFTYSDGMKFRLALAIAIHSDCEVLVIDEIFVSGDADFQQKTIDTFKEIQNRRNITTIVTSQIPSFVWAFSDKFYLMDNGTIKAISGKEMSKLVAKVDKTWRRKMLIAD